MKKLLLALVAVASSASVLAQSAVPNLMSYQSRVADAAGVPLGATAPVNRIVLFRIYDSPNLSAAANRLFSEQQTVTIAAGEFSVLIGSGTPIATEGGNAFSTLSSAVFGGATRYLGVTVDDGDGNPFNDPELSPRQQIVGTPFAFRAQVAEAVGAGGVNALALANNSVGTAALVAGSVTGAKLATGAVGPGQIADAAVGTGQVIDSSLTLAKLADNAVDGSKIVDGSINLTDLSSSLVSVMPKPSTVYNQGLGAFTKNPASSNHQWMIFPIDVSDLGVDGEVLISYQGRGKDYTWSSQTFGNVFGPFQSGTPTIGTFAGSVRIILPNFGAGSAVGGISGNYEGTASNNQFALVYGNTGAATAAPATNIQFVAYHQGMGTRYNYGVTGVLAPTNSPGNLLTAFVGGMGPANEAAPPYTPSAVSFPKILNQWAGNFVESNPSVLLVGSVNNLNSFVYFTSAAPLAAAVATAPSTNFNGANISQSGVGSNGATYTNVSTLFRGGNQIPLFYIFHYYPGTISGNTTAPYNADIFNASTITGAAGAPQVYTISSAQVGTNKLTITVPATHVMQVGDTVTLSGVSGAPAVNASYPIAAVPNSTSFEIAVPGAAGPYTGGTVTHTLAYNKYRLWVAVHASVNARVIVSDK